MTPSAKGRLLLAIGVAPACWPVAHGLFGVWRAAFGGEGFAGYAAGVTLWPDLRVGGLLLHSVWLSLAAGVGATLLASVVAVAFVLGMQRSTRRGAAGTSSASRTAGGPASPAGGDGATWRLALTLALLASFCLGSVVHLMAWRGVLGAFGVDPGGWVVGIAVLSWRYAPLAAAVLVAGLAAADAGELEAAGVTGGRTAAWRMAKIRLLALAGMATFAVAVLVFGESELPSLLGLRVYAEEFLTNVALEPNPGAAAALGWPMMLAAVLAAWSLSRLPPAAPAANEAVAPGWLARWTWETDLARGALQLAALGVAVLPTLLLALSAVLSRGRWPASAAAALGNSLAVAGAVSLLACLWAMLVASLAVSVGEHTHRWLRGLLLLLMMWPSSLTGLALAGVAWPAWLGERTPLVVAHALRVMPFAAWVLIEARRSGSVGVESQLQVLGPRGVARWHAWRRVRGPAMAVGLAGAAAVGAGLSLAELSATVLTVAPGFETVILRLYNLLHYGDQRGVMALALTQAVLMVAAAGALVGARWAWGRRRARVR